MPVSRPPPHPVSLFPSSALLSKPSESKCEIWKFKTRQYGQDKTTNLARPGVGSFLRAPCSLEETDRLVPMVGEREGRRVYTGWTDEGCVCVEGGRQWSFIVK